MTSPSSSDDIILRTETIGHIEAKETSSPAFPEPEFESASESDDYDNAQRVGGTKPQNHHNPSSISPSTNFHTVENIRNFPRPASHLSDIPF